MNYLARLVRPVRALNGEVQHPLSLLQRFPLVDLVVASLQFLSKCPICAMVLAIANKFQGVLVSINPGATCTSTYCTTSPAVANVNIALVTCDRMAACMRTCFASEMAAMNVDATPLNVDPVVACTRSCFASYIAIVNVNTVPLYVNPVVAYTRSCFH